MQNYYTADNGGFATFEELYASYRKVMLGYGPTKASGVPIISNGKEILVTGVDENVLIIGSTGSMKTLRVVLPSMLSLLFHGEESCIVHDPKAEVIRHVLPILKKRGIRVFILNFREPLRGHRYNLLYRGVQLYKQGNIAEAINCFMELGIAIYKGIEGNEPYWTETSKDYFTSLCLCLCKEMESYEVTLENVFDLFIDGMERVGSDSVLQAYFKYVNPDKKTRQFATSTLTAPNETRASVHAVFSSGLTRLIIDEKLTDMLGGESDFQIIDILKEKTFVFLITKDESSVHDSLISCMVDQWYTELIEEAEKNGGQLKRPVTFVLDEFANMAKIKDIDAKISAARSRRIRFFVVLQSLRQLSHIYGDDLANIIIGNCQNWYYLHSSDPDLNKKISEMCGSYFTEYTREERKLMPLEKLQYLSKEKGEVLLLLNRHRPFVTRLPAVFDYDCYAGKGEIDCPERKIKKVRSFDIKAAVEEAKEQEFKRKQAERDHMMSVLFGKKEPWRPDLDDDDDDDIIPPPEFDFDENKEENFSIFDAPDETLNDFIKKVFPEVKEEKDKEE